MGKELADLVRPADHTNTPTPTPIVMTGEVLDLSPLKVKVPEYDGGKTAFKAFGRPPYADVGNPPAVGDEVKVALDSNGGFVLVAWEA